MHICVDVFYFPELGEFWCLTKKDGNVIVTPARDAVPTTFCVCVRAREC